MINQITTEDEKEFALERIREIKTELNDEKASSLETEIADLEFEKKQLEDKINEKKADLKTIKDARKEIEKPLKKEIADITKMLGEYEANKVLAA